MVSGFVFNIQRYCLHDGPGIRSSVFLKGCPLNCWWCHNPESQTRQPEIHVIVSRCLRCGECIAACPQHQASPEGADPAACTRCGCCVEVCPTGARDLIGRQMSVDQVLQEVLRDRVFFDDSGGGVTVSGGEPLLQPDFVLALLAACRAHAVHTSLDTCGYAPQQTLLDAAPLTDLFLYDVKTLDDTAHQRHTGVSNQIILANLDALAQVHHRIWIRVPLIPGFNDSASQLAAIAHHVADIPSVEQVHLLPYHDMGQHKRSRTRVAQPAEPHIPSTQQLQAAAETFRACGLQTYIGG